MKHVLLLFSLALFAVCAHPPFPKTVAAEKPNEMIWYNLAKDRTNEPGLEITLNSTDSTNFCVISLIKKFYPDSSLARFYFMSEIVDTVHIDFPADRIVNVTFSTGEKAKMIAASPCLEASCAEKFSLSWQEAASFCDDVGEALNKGFADEKAFLYAMRKKGFIK